MATTLVLAMFAGVGAQVTTLRTPDPDAEASPAPVAVELEGQEAILAFASCMRDNGIDIDDPQFGPGGGLFGRGGGPGGGGPQDFDFGSTEFQSAFEVCGTFLASLRPELDQAQLAEVTEQRVALAECMRAKDHDFPDPDPNGGFGFGAGARAALDFDDPAFQSDFQECQSSVGGLGFGPGGGGPGGNGGVAD